VVVGEQFWNGPAERTLGGAGFGGRYAGGLWAVEALIAWRVTGGRPLSDSRDTNPRV